MSLPTKDDIAKLNEQINVLSARLKKMEETKGEGQ
jgi:hypothetical protein